MLLEITSFKELGHSIAYEYLGKTGVKLADFAGSLIGAFLILLIGLKVAKYIVNLSKRIMDRTSIDPTLETFLISFIRIGSKILVIFMAVTKLGVAESSIVALLGSAGLALGLSLQGSLANIAGGVILLLLKPFKVGDYILEESSGKEGTVQAIGIMYTKLVTVDNKAIMIPNGNLSNSSITNITFQEKRSVNIKIGVEYKENIKRVREALMEVIGEEPDRLAEEPVKIFVSEFKDSCIEMELRYWVKTENYWESRWRVLEKIKEKFDEEHIAIPFNQLEVNVIAMPDK
ncbi:MAG: mechanosensitive ion channel [Eubacterium sp.]|nr:mechanosensitive ion channel [Eubacterium sp.]MDD7210669.1 mechanosensitive ion channel [Lachnospiraceae bacterium]MDY5497653.1 mechanosensitive ion channel [Anaerobutyricum sp.]